MPEWYAGEGVVFCFDLTDAQRPQSIYAHLLRLQKEGYMEVSFEPNENRNDSVRLVNLALTTSGHKLLAELQEKSFYGKVLQSFWTIVVSVFTTLITLYLIGRLK